MLRFLLPCFFRSLTHFLPTVAVIVLFKLFVDCVQLMRVPLCVFMYMCMSRMVSLDSILRIVNNVIIVNIVIFHEYILLKHIVMIFHEYILLKQQRQQFLHHPGFQRQQLLLHCPGFQFAVHFSSVAPAVKFKAVC